MKSWLKSLVIAIGKLILKIGLVVIIGAVISYTIYYIKGFQMGTTMRVVGVVIACIGLLSQLGEANIRSDYNYNMAKMRNPKILESEHNGNLTSGSLVFLLWMGTSGIVLFLIGNAII